VHRELKRIANLNYEHIVRENEVIHDRGDHLFDVDIVTAKGVGSVISADYQSQFSIERHLLRAAQDVEQLWEGARERQPRHLHLLPHRIELPTKLRLELEDYLLTECWKLEPAAFRSLPTSNLNPSPRTCSTGQRHSSLTLGQSCVLSERPHNKTRSTSVDFSNTRVIVNL
jgi:hypothetical protein